MGDIVAHPVPFRCENRDKINHLNAFAMIRDNVEVRLRIVEADYGRRCGWYVERNGRRVGSLSESTFCEMFWDRYRIEPMPDAASAVLLFEDSYWCSPKYLFRNRTFPNYVVEAMGPLEDGHTHVRLRFLYIVPAFTLWERIRYAWRLFRAGYQQPTTEILTQRTPFKIPIADELPRRRPVWEALSDLFLDTELTETYYRHIARRVLDSGYSPSEIHFILWQEVFPVLEFNLRHPAGVWEGFTAEWLEHAIRGTGERQTPQEQPQIATAIRDAWREVCRHLPAEFA